MKERLEIMDILRDLHKVSGFRISLHDAEHNEICAFPREGLPFCRTVQRDTAVLQQCRECDIKNFAAVRETGKPRLYRCPQGLYEAVAPIYHYGVLSGFLMMGQARTPDPQLAQHLYDTAFRITGDSALAKELADSIPTVEDAVATAYLNLATILAEYLTATNRVATAGGKLAECIAQYIRKNYAQVITLQHLSDAFGYSVATLTKAFRTEYGCTIFQYLRDTRLDAAAKLLTDTRKTMNVIAETCGFSDQNYFSRVFTAQYGCSPTVYRKSHS